MNIPHVERLYYRVVKDEYVRYDRATPIEDENDDFKVTMDGEWLIFDLKTHCSSEDEAKTVVEEYILGWEISIGLENRPDDLRFILDRDRTKIIELSPSKDRTISSSASINRRISVGADAILVKCHDKFPGPLKSFKPSHLAKRLYTRYREYCQNREKLPPMAYFCLSEIEKGADNRKGKKRANTAREYCISIDVLNHLGRLSAQGDPLEARKAPKGEEHIPLSAKEKKWLEAAVKFIIQRVGEHAHDPTNLKQITMEDFPSLAE